MTSAGTPGAGCPAGTVMTCAAHGVTKRNPPLSVPTVSAKPVSMWPMRGLFIVLAPLVCHGWRITGRVAGIPEVDTIDLLYKKRMEMLRLCRIDYCLRKAIHGEPAVLKAEHQRKAYEEKHMRTLGIVLFEDLISQITHRAEVWWYARYR